MDLNLLLKLYRTLGWLDFYGRCARRLFDFAVPQTSYSQSGEDAIIDFLFQSVGVKPVYLEIGTNHPKYLNNTYKFYRAGCRGVLVEANPLLAKKIRRRRRRDKLLNVGVGIAGNTSMMFYVMKNDGLSTFSEAEVEQRKQAGDSVRMAIPIKMMTINEILTNHFERCPDLLSIDIEGFDLPVLESMDFDRFSIPVICAETCQYSTDHIKPNDDSIERFLSTKGYFKYASTYINTIFVNQNWFLNVNRNT